MKIFLSHSSRDKALVREIRSYLPSHVQTWLDSDELIIGDELETSIRNAINEQCDFVVIFLGREAVESDWVKRELEWAIARENELGYVFVLPVLLEDVWSRVEPASFQDRIYLECFDQTKENVKHLAEKLSSQIFVWVCRRLDEAAAQVKESDKAKSIPSEISLKFLADIRASHWVQASKYNTEHTRKVTSLYIPLRLENLDRRKSVTLKNVEIVETISGTKVMPPRQVQIKVPGGQQPWVYSGCNITLQKIFNVGETTVAPASAEETAIILQEAEVHREEYNLSISFEDEYSRTYSYDRCIRVEDYSNWQNVQDEWLT